MIKKIIRKRAKRSKIWLMPKEELIELTKNSERLGDIFLISGLWDDLIILSVLSGVFA